MMLSNKGKKICKKIFSNTLEIKLKYAIIKNL